MRRFVCLLAVALLASTALASPSSAAPKPGDTCAPEGDRATFDQTTMNCQGGRWVLEGPPPSGPGAGPSASPGQDPVSPGGAPGSSSVKALKNFRTIGTALDASTFDSDGRQVADATAIRLDNGKIRLFAFVNSSVSLPGTLSATSTNKRGTRFTADAQPPLPGVAAGQPRIVPLGGDSMRLFYVQGGNINSALSTDNGRTFTVEGPVITSDQAGFEPGGITVIRHKGKWRAYFSNLEKPGERTPRVMRTATSSNMLDWTMGPIITQGSGPLKDGGSHPFAVVDKGRIALYYAGDRGGFYGILVSTSKNGIRFRNERSVIPGGGDPDIVRVGKKKWIMYYGADLGDGNFGIKVARSKGPVVPKK